MTVAQRLRVLAILAAAGHIDHVATGHAREELRADVRALTAEQRNAFVAEYGPNVLAFLQEPPVPLGNLLSLLTRQP